MKKVKAILLDFDGTALQKDQVYISIRNMSAIRKALEKGVYVIPSTGRSEDMQPPQIEKDERIRYYVTSGGTRVVDHATGEIIYKHVFTPEQSAHLCRIFEDRDLYVEIAAEGKLYVQKSVAEKLELYPIPPHHVWYIEEDRLIPIERPSEYFLKNGICIEKVNMYGIPKDMQQEIYDEVEQTGFAHITDPLGANMQFFPADLDRTVAIQALMDKLGITMEEVMSIGDSNLDADAIRDSGVGVAMGNASDDVKKLADFVTLPFDQDGVAVAIEKFVLNT